MTWTLAVGAIAFVFCASALLALINPAGARAARAGPLEAYLLAGGTLGRVSLVNLLLSSSFGLNAVFYQVWLGFTVGAWGLLIQLAWAFSFYLLSKHVETITERRSLHDLLGTRFGSTTRVIAGVCSIVGMMYLIGWEVGIGKNTFAGLLEAEIGQQNQVAGAVWLVGGIVFGALLYTILGGLRGNAYADTLANLLKFAVFSTLAYLLWQIASASGTFSYKEALFPSWSTMEEKLGFWGLITNIAFSLAWQFVDTSSWQSIIASRRTPADDLRWNLTASGAAILVAPGIIGTFLGAFLFGMKDVSQDTVLAAAVSAIPDISGVLLFAIFAAIAACIMSLIDGLFLATGYVLIVDLLHPRKTLEELDIDVPSAERLLALLRVLMFVVAVGAAWGVQALLAAFNLKLFDFVYVVILTQLALAGPVFVALSSSGHMRCPMWLSIIVALIAGFGCTIWGVQNELPKFVDAAGTLTIVVSYAVAKGVLLARRAR